MRVLYFVESFWPLIGGVEVASASVLPLLAERGHEMMVITDRSGEWLAEEDRLGPVPIRRLPFVRAIHDRDLELLAESRMAISAIVREHRPDLIHALFTGAGVWVLPPADVAPTVVSFHGPWPTMDWSSGGLGARVLSRASWVTACSEAALADLLETAPQLEQRSSVILNGLDATFEGDPPARPAGAPVLLCSGRIVHDKGVDVAIDALAEIVGEYPEVRLLIAGDGTELESLRTRVASLGLENHVDFLGWVLPADMHKLVARASIVLVPSRIEGFGLVALEAALMARPVLATRIGGLMEVVADGVTGLLVAPDDPIQIAEAVRRLLRDEDLAAAMGRAGRERALAEFSAGRHADDWDALYRRIGSRNTEVMGWASRAPTG